MPTTPYSRARRTRMCRGWLACASCSPTRRHSIPSSPPTTPSRSPRSMWRQAARLRVPAPARHGRGALRGGRGRGQAGGALSHLCARRPARGPRRLSGAPSARERRQYLVRQPSGRRGGAARGHHSRSRRHRRDGAGQAGQAAAPTARHLSARAPQQRRLGARRAGGARRHCWRRLRRSSMPHSLPLRRSSMARRWVAARRWSWC